MKRLAVCGIVATGLVCLAATLQAGSVTNEPSDTGHIENGNHASARNVMDAGWHASPGEDKHSALFRFDLSAYNDWRVDGAGTLYVYCGERQPNAGTFYLYKLRQTADDWEGTNMFGVIEDWHSILTTERQNAIDDGPIGSGDFSGTGFRSVSVPQAVIDTMIWNGAADRGVMLDNSNTVNNTRVYLKGIEWGTPSQRPYLIFPATHTHIRRILATEQPSDTGWVETSNHASSRSAINAGVNAYAEFGMSGLLRWDLSAYQSSFMEVDGPGTLYVYCGEKQGNAGTFNLYKLRQTVPDWDGDSMGGGGSYDPIGTGGRQNAIDDGSIGDGDFSGTGFRQVSVSQAVIEAMILNGAADRGVMLDNGNTEDWTRVYLRGIGWGTPSERPYLEFHVLLHPPKGTMIMVN